MKKPRKPLKAGWILGLKAACTTLPSKEGQLRHYNSPISVFQARAHTIHTPRYVDGGSSCGLDT